MVQIKLILYFLTYFFNKINPTSYTRWGRWSLLPEWKIEWGTSVGSTGSWYWRRFFSWPRQVDLKWFDATKTYVPTRKYVRTVFNVRLPGVPWFNKRHFRSYLSSVVCLIRSSRTCQWHDGRACRNLAVFFHDHLTTLASPVWAPFTDGLCRIRAAARLSGSRGIAIVAIWLGLCWLTGSRELSSCCGLFRARAWFSFSSPVRRAARVASAGPAPP